jgi:hypothetical protein
MPWVKGQSGNPKGKHANKRERVSAAYLNDLNAVWRSHGRAALEKAAIEEPAQFAALVSRLLPKDTQVSVTHGLSEGFLAAIRNANDQRTLRGHSGATIEHEPKDAVLIPLIDKDKVE